MAFWAEPPSLIWLNAVVAGLAVVDAAALAGLLGHHGWTWAVRRFRARFYIPLEEVTLTALAQGVDILLPRRPWERAWLGEILTVLRPVLSGAARDRITAILEERGYVAAWVREAASRRWWRRAAAAKRLGASGSPEALPALRAALSDRHPEVRQQALRALARLGLPAAAEMVLASAAAIPVGRAWLQSTLLIIAEQNPEVVRAMLRRGAPAPVVKACVEALGAAGHRPAEADLLALAEDADPELRVSAVRALGRLRTPAGEAVLVGALGDSDWRVRAAAARGLSRPIDEPAAAAALAAALGDPVWWVRRNAAFALAGFPAGEAVLVGALAADDRFVREMAWFALQASGALGRLRPALLEAAGRNPFPDLREKILRGVEGGVA